MTVQTREQLDERIAALRAEIPDILAGEEKDQMESFACHADEILAAAGDADHDHVWSALQCVLRDAGLIPGDDEPCAEE